MMTPRTEILCAISIILVLSSFTTAFEVFPIAPIDSIQQTPDVDNGIVVWAEWVEGDWDVYGVDLLNGSGELIYVAAYIGSDQTSPAIWNDRVVYQDYYVYAPPAPEGDWDVYVSDISDTANPVSYFLTPNEVDYVDDQIHPVIHSNTAVWQSYVTVDDGQGGTLVDWDILAADITETNNPLVYVVDNFIADQTSPAVYRTTAIYEDNTEGNVDIWSADVWLKNAPQYQKVVSDAAAQTGPAVWNETVVYEHETAGGDYDVLARDISRSDSEPFVIAAGPGLQQAPDISGHLVVWQDNRNGNWDIYGHNMITRKEFRITTDDADQTNPAISGSLVTWEDLRDAPGKPMQIYYTWLDGDVIADCPVSLTGDINGDCRVNLADYALMVEEWLICALDPVSACTN